MELTVLERILLLGILPKESDIIMIKTVRDLKDYVGFTEDEHAVLKFVQDEGSIKWTPNTVYESKEFEFKGKASQVISEALIKMNKDKKITEQFISLHDKFIEVDN